VAAELCVVESNRLGEMSAKEDRVIIESGSIKGRLGAELSIRKPYFAFELGVREISVPTEEGSGKISIAPKFHIAEVCIPREAYPTKVIISLFDLPPDGQMLLFIFCRAWVVQDTILFTFVVKEFVPMTS